MASIPINSVPWDDDMPMGFIKSPKVLAPVPHDTGGGVTYRMRGLDTTLSTLVFWDAPVVDATASYYTGPGPVTGIVVQKQIGAD